MNPLDAIKQKLMVKPMVKEREKVAVVIQGEEKSQTKKQKLEKEKPEKKELEEGEELEEKEEATFLPQKTLIIDETSKGFDREAFLKRLKERNLNKVTMKPILEEAQEKGQLEPISFVPPPETKIKKPKKMSLKKFIIHGEEGEEAKEQEQSIVQEPAIIEEQEEPAVAKEVIQVEAPVAEKKRKTKKVEKGVAVLGPEIVVNIGDTDLRKRMPRLSPPIKIKASSYYMNNREIFINFINSLFEPYRLELQQNKENISCDDIGNTSSDFSLLTHQEIVRDYMNLYTPYRGLLLYHGLGSGKTCTSIAIAEGMKEGKKVIIMTPASLRANYIEELKKCGDLLYKRNQFWEWISTDTNPEATESISAILNLPLEYIRKHHGAWFININKKSNYDELTDQDKQTLEAQLNEMIKQKYQFINYNGLRTKRLEELTSGFTKNLFDNAVVVIDEAHNLISRIVNKIKKEKPIDENERGEKEKMPIYLAVKLYEYLLSAKNAKIILLSGTPIINYPNEFGILFNILRGYIKTWKIPLNVKTSKKIDRNSLQEMLVREKSLDYLDYSPASKVLTITRNPFGFKNKLKKDFSYQGVSNVVKDDKGNSTVETDFATDDDFERKIISVLRQNDIEVISSGIRIQNKKALPDTFELFEGQYIDATTKKIKNIDALKRRIIGLSSYFRSAQENLLPRYNKTLGKDYHVVRIPMSDFQFKIYETERQQERKMEKQKRVPKLSDDYDASSTYRIFSRLFCNFVMPDRPRPKVEKDVKGDDEEEEEQGEEKEQREEGEQREEKEQGEEGEEKGKGVKKGKEEGKKETSDIRKLMLKAKREEAKQDVENEQEGEVEGDEILDKLGGTDYKERLEAKLNELKLHSSDFLTPEALQTYSPKFLHMLENITDPEYQGLHLVYSQFRTMEGIGIFSLVLEKNGFARFQIKKNSIGNWVIDINEADQGKPTYALYTGTETSEEKEMLRHIYNGEWDQVPESIAQELRKMAHNNNMGEIIKVFMITSSGSEGINLRNTRYVHIMEPYWHPVRVEQVIGRARRICSHKALPKELQTVEVFVYLMIFSPQQLKSDEAIELKRKDLSKSVPKVPITSDQYLYEISEIKANLTLQLTDAVKESAFDCYIYSNGKCVNFGDPTSTKFSYVPDYSEQQNDTTVRANKVAIDWVGYPMTWNGVKYVYRTVDRNTRYIYDYDSYQAALKDPSIIPLQIGTMEINENGEQVFKAV
jgi:hypothetical protein